MNEETYMISFENVSPHDARRYIGELRNMLFDTVPDIQIEQKRDNALAQDFGLILIAILGTSSVTALAKALGDWLKLRHSVEITIKTGKEEIIGKNLTSKDATQLANLLLTKKSGEHKHE